MIIYKLIIHKHWDLDYSMGGGSSFALMALAHVADSVRNRLGNEPQNILLLINLILVKLILCSYTSCLLWMYPVITMHSAGHVTQVQLVCVAPKLKASRNVFYYFNEKLTFISGFIYLQHMYWYIKYQMGLSFIIRKGTGRIYGKGNYKMLKSSKKLSKCLKPKLNKLEYFSNNTYQWLLSIDIYMIKKNNDHLNNTIIIAVFL